MRSFSRGLAVLVAACGLAACTTIGAHDHAAREDMDFGPPETLRFCVLRDDGVAPDRARRMIDAIGREFATYAIQVRLTAMESWRRPGFAADAILNDVVRRPLDAPCDRLVALVGRHAGDALWGLVMPEILGAVETATHTKGYVVATRASLNQVLSGPEDTAVHEAYHFLGCGHDVVMTECYRRIRAIKDHARANRTAGRDFFPGLDPEGRVLPTRATVQARFQAM